MYVGSQLDFLLASILGTVSKQRLSEEKIELKFFYKTIPMM